MVCALHSQPPGPWLPGMNVGRSAATDRNGDEMKARSSVFAIVTLVMLLTLPAGAGEKLTITVSPAVAFAPATLIVRARIDADPDNRAMEIVADGGAMARCYAFPPIEIEGAS